MINFEEVKHIADLARLDFEKEELLLLQKELSLILDYVDKLKEVDIEGIQPYSHSPLLKNVLREDKAPLKKGEIKKDLVDLAPEKKDSFVKIKSVF